MPESKKTKIIYCITKSAFGGAGKYVLDLATSIPKDEFDVAVALGGKGILIEKLQKENIKVIPVRSIERDIGIIKDIKVLFELYGIFKLEKPDIIHLNSSKMGGIGALAGRLARVPKIVFTAHGWPFNENRNLLSKVTIWLLSWFTVILSNKTITINNHDYLQGKNLPFCKNKIELIWNGISGTFDTLTKDIAKKELETKTEPYKIKSKIVLGTIAELHENKGLEYAIEAVAELPDKILEDVSFIIIGEGELHKKLEQLITKKKLEKKVFITGFIDNASKYLPAFDIFMLSSIKEGLPYVLLEAGIYSLPVIATNIGGIPDLIKNDETGILVQPKRPQRLKSAIIKLIENKKISEKLGKELNKLVFLNFNTKTMIEKIKEVYKQ